MNIALLLLVFAVGDKPALLHSGNNFLTITLSNDLLDDPATRRRLLSGLTLSIELETSLNKKGGKQKGHTLITARYDVWAEEILLQLLEGDGQVSSHSFKSLDELFGWLDQYPIKLMALSTTDYPLKIKVVCRVVPYSSEEARQTRDWFSQRLKVARASERGLVGGEGISGAGSNGVFEVLMSSGIRERAFQAYHWKWQLERRADP